VPATSQDAIQLQYRGLMTDVDEEAGNVCLALCCGAGAGHPKQAAAAG
jgi:hypothetical protein